MRFNKGIYLYTLIDAASSASISLSSRAPSILGLGCWSLRDSVLRDSLYKPIIMDRLFSSQLLAPEIKEICFYLDQYPGDGGSADLEGVGKQMPPRLIKAMVWEMVENAITRFEFLHRLYEERSSSLIGQENPSGADILEYRQCAGMLTLLPKLDSFVVGDGWQEAMIKKDFKEILKNSMVHPQLVYHFYVSLTIDPEYLSSWLDGYGRKCSTTVSDAQAGAISQLPREVKVALVFGFARIAKMSDDITEAAKTEACGEMIKTLEGLNVYKDGSNNLFAIEGVKMVLTALNEVLPPLD